MSGDLKKRLIFSIGTEVSDITEKRLHNANQFKKFSSKLREGLKQYAENCNADFNLTTFTTKNYDDLNNRVNKDHGQHHSTPNLFHCINNKSKS